jgi:hypothetical protein
LLVEDPVRLDRPAVAAWLEEVTASTPPPDLRVSPDALDLLEQSIHGLRAMPSFEERDPGCYLFFIDREEAGTAGRDAALDLRALAARITAAAREVNRRLEVEWESPARDTEPGNAKERDEFGSYIILSNGRNVPSIGPGGHVFIEQRRDTIFGSASVRPFTVSRPAGSWASVDSVFSELGTFLDQGLNFFPAFGYYEGSWMERQALIRPTIAFVIETGEDAPYPQRWEMAMSATTTSGPAELFHLG